jgi:hypothetical protein
MQLYIPSDKAPKFAFPIVFKSFTINSEVNAPIEMRSGRGKSKQRYFQRSVLSPSIMPVPLLFIIEFANCLFS